MLDVVKRYISWTIYLWHLLPLVRLQWLITQRVCLNTALELNAVTSGKGAPPRGNPKLSNCLKNLLSWGTYLRSSWFAVDSGRQYCFWNLIKGIVSRDWEQIQWIPSVKSEKCRVAGAYFFPVLMPFSCFNSKNMCFVSFSFDSYSANDK